MRMYFAFDQDQLEALQAHGLPEGATIGVTDFGMAHLLDANGCNAVDLWQFISGDDVASAFSGMRTVSASWWEPFLGDLQHKGISLAECFHRDMWYAIYGMLITEMMMGKALTALKPTEAIICDPLEQPIFWDAVIPAPGGLPANVARHTLEHRGIPTTVIPAGTARSAPASSTPDSCLLPQLSEAASNRHSETLCIFMGDLERRQHGEVLSSLAGESNNTLWLKGGNAEFAITDSDISVSWYDLLGCFGPDSDLQEKLKAAWSHFEAKKDSPEIIHSPHLRGQMSAFWDRLLLGGRIIDACHWLMDTYGPRVCLQGLDAYGPAKVWGRAMRSRGATTVNLKHGTLAPNFHQYEKQQSEADILVVDTAHAFEKMQGFTAQNQHIRQLHAPYTQDTPLPPAEQKRIVLMTANATYGVYGQMTDPIQVRKRWDELFQLMNNHPDWDFVIKPHPRYDHFMFYENAALPENCSYNRDIPLNTAFQSASAAVMVGYPSSAVIEAIQAAIPTFFLQANYPAAELNSALDELADETLIVDDTTALERTLHRVMEDETFKEKARSNGSRFLDLFFGHTSHDKVDKAQSILQCVNELMNQSDPANSNNRQ